MYNQAKENKRLAGLLAKKSPDQDHAFQTDQLTDENVQMRPITVPTTTQTEPDQSVQIRPQTVTRTTQTDLEKDQDLEMPPKITWFEPKLRSGLFVHSLNGLDLT